MSIPKKNKNAVALGRLGGLAGKGSSKVRDPQKMRQAALKRWAKSNPNPAAIRRPSVIPKGAKPDGLLYWAKPLSGDDRQCHRFFFYDRSKDRWPPHLA